MYQSKDSGGVTVAMLRAFITLSKTLNLTKACDELKTTRQTVRRHINDLERIKGQPLFVVENREYSMTPFGKASVADAETILRHIETWSGQSQVTKQSSQWLEVSSYLDPDGREFFSQQQPMFRLASNGLPIMKTALGAWGMAQTQIEDPAMADVRPYLVIYRKGANGWVFVEVGKSSAYAQWFGWAWSKSAIGKLMQEDNVGDDFNEFISGAYARIYGEGGVRLDHLYAYLPKEGSDEVIPVSFQRLLMGCVFPDGTPGLGVLVLITNNIEIDALESVDVPGVPQELVMDFEL
ncbi:LysR family transcriptional regulator [Sulfitobacter sp. MF3-043]|uniref:LysR family transcriptional regulator n=1 Tax=Sulfitobacter sediminivivens TaxID=3252902 RepID=UPI0036D9D5D1